MEVTIEIDNDILCAKVRKVALQWILVKITDDECANHLQNSQIKVWVKDKHKIEPVLDMNDITQNSAENTQNIPPNIPNNDCVPQSILRTKKTAQKGSKHVKYSLTLSQETKVTEKERLTVRLKV